MQISDDIFLGPAVCGGSFASDGPSTMTVGVGPLGRVMVYDIVPLALNLTGLAAAQGVGAAGNLTLTAGTGVTATVVNGVTRYVLDVPRCVDVLSAGADTTQTVLISGYDVYGQAMSQLITLGGTGVRVATTKAFKSVVTMYVSALTAGNVSAGTTDVVGLPIRLLSKDYIQFNYNATFGLIAAVTGAVLTSPATTATGDVRGTIALATASDGAKRLVAQIAVPAIACGPNATRLGAYGVTQV
jgi:hypothetical protein